MAYIFGMMEVTSPLIEFVQYLNWQGNHAKNLIASITYCINNNALSKIGYLIIYREELYLLLGALRIEAKYDNYACGNEAN